MDSQTLSAAFAARGLNELSTAVAKAGDSEEAIVLSVARILATEPDARIKALDEAGVDSVESFAKLRQDAEYGKEQENILRAETKKLAIAALGKEKGEARAASIDGMSRDLLQDISETFKVMEAERTGRNTDGTVKRLSAGSKLDNVHAETVDGNADTSGDDLLATTLSLRGAGNGVGTHE